MARARSDHIFRDLRSLTILLPNCDLRSLTITFSKSWTIRSRSWSAIILPITPLLCLIVQRAVFLWKEPYILKAHDLGMSKILRSRDFGMNIWIFPLENGYKGNEIRSKIPFFAGVEIRSLIEHPTFMQRSRSDYKSLIFGIMQCTALWFWHVLAKLCDRRSFHDHSPKIWSTITHDHDLQNQEKMIYDHSWSWSDLKW